MAIRRKRIQQLVDELLKENAIVQPPVPVQRIVKSQGLLVRKQENTASDISGFLFRRGRDAVIGVNASNVLTRQRFTIAHELGHFLLHALGRAEAIHIDRAFDIKFRDDVSSQGTDTDEREANLFAAELLMPSQFISKDLANIEEMDLIDDAFIKSLARRYQVSTQALTFRLVNLGYLSL